MKRIVSTAALVVGLAWPALAGAPQFWRIEGTSGFLEGQLEELSLDSEARLRLGRDVRTLFDLAAPNGWTITPAGGSAWVVGTGNEGLVYRVEGEKGEVLLDAAELEVHAVVVGPDRRTYAATSPEGAVHVVEPDGKSRVFFDPPDKYIWALAFDDEGRLLVATGDEGRIYRVQADGTSETLLESTQTHVRCLATGADGRVYAGSSPEGIVYRIDGPGKAFVVLDSPFNEVTALAVSEGGAVYAALSGAETSSPSPTPPQPSGSTPTAQVTVTETFTVATPAGVPGAVAGASEGGSGGPSARGAVVRIDAGGGAETLWTSTEDAAFSLLRSGGGLLVGTGPRGNLYRVNDDQTWSLLAHVPAQQVTALALAADGGAAIATSNPARVLALAAQNATRGTYTSEVRDAESIAAFGQIGWEGRSPDGSRVLLETRSGNTETPDSTWGPWTPAGAGAENPASVRSESARYLQVRAVLEGNGSTTPEIEAISAAYLQRNPGEVFQKPISVSGEPEILGLPPDSQAETGADRTPPGAPAATSFSRRMQQRGLRTFSWSAADPNHDALVYHVQYRAVGDQTWRLLRQGVTEPVLAWDTSAVPDGRYVVRVTASDAPDNPPALALSGHRDSSSFEVDNAPPSLETSLARSGPRRVHVVVRDAGSAIRRLEFSVDAGRWQEVHPVDGINDSREETYDFPIPPSDTTAPRVVVVRASDLLGNVATGRIDVP